MLSYTFNVTTLPANTLARTTVPAALVDPAAGHPTLQRAGQHAVFVGDLQKLTFSAPMSPGSLTTTGWVVPI